MAILYKSKQRKNCEQAITQAFSNDAFILSHGYNSAKYTADTSIIKPKAETIGSFDDRSIFKKEGNILSVIESQITNVLANGHYEYDTQSMAARTFKNDVIGEDLNIPPAELVKYHLAYNHLKSSLQCWNLSLMRKEIT